MIDQLYSCLDNQIFASEDLARARAGNSPPHAPMPPGSIGGAARLDIDTRRLDSSTPRLLDSLDHTSQSMTDRRLQSTWQIKRRQIDI